MQDMNELKRKAELLKRAAEELSVQESELPKTLERFLRESEELEQKLKKLRTQ